MLGPCVPRHHDVARGLSLFGSDQIMLGSKYLDLYSAGLMGPPSFMMYLLWMLLAKRPTSSLERSTPLIHTVTPWSVMSCCCDAPLSNPVTIICRWGIRLLTPGPKRHIRGVIIQWKLAGWYHSTSIQLSEESMNPYSTFSQKHDITARRAVTVQYMCCTGWWETLNVKWVTPSHTLLLMPCYHFFLKKLEQQLITGKVIMVIKYNGTWVTKLSGRVSISLCFLFFF